MLKIYLLVVGNFFGTKQIVVLVSNYAFCSNRLHRLRAPDEFVLSVHSIFRETSVIHGKAKRTKTNFRYSAPNAYSLAREEHAVYDEIFSNRLHAVRRLVTGSRRESIVLGTVVPWSYFFSNTQISRCESVAKWPNVV